MKANLPISIGCGIFLLSSFSFLSVAKNVGADPRLTGSGSVPTRQTQPGNRPTATPLFNVTRAGSNMIRLGGAPSVPHSAGAVSGSRVGPSSRINGQEFPRAMGSR